MSRITGHCRLQQKLSKLSSFLFSFGGGKPEVGLQFYLAQCRTVSSYPKPRLESIEIWIIFHASVFAPCCGLDGGSNFGSKQHGIIGKRGCSLRQVEGLFRMLFTSY